MSDDKKDADEKPETPNVLDPVEGEAAAPKKKKSSGGKLLVLLVGIVIVAFVIVLAGTEYFEKRGSESAGTRLCGEGFAERAEAARSQRGGDEHALSHGVSK